MLLLSPLFNGIILIGLLLYYLTFTLQDKLAMILLYIYQIIPNIIAQNLSTLTTKNNSETKGLFQAIKYFKSLTPSSL